MSALPAVGGLAGLLAVGGAAAWTVLAAEAWQDVTRPARRGLGWALAQGLPAAPSDMGLAHEERTCRTDETTIPAWWITGRAGGTSPTVIVLHGHGRSRWDSLRRIGPWVDRAGLLVLPDLRGHGDAPGRCTVGRREAADVSHLVTEAERVRPGAPVVLAGHSMGAVIAIHTAAVRAAAGAPVDAVIAWGPYDRVRTPFEARMRLRGLPPRPVSDAVLGALRAIDGPEVRTTILASRLGSTRLDVWADEGDAVSPLADAESICRAAGGTLHRTQGIAHADLGTAPMH